MNSSIVLNFSLALLMSCKLNTSDILAVTEDGTVETSTKPDEKKEGLPITIQGKVILYL